MIVVLGIDPGFASLGLSAVELDGRRARERVLESGVIRTEKSSRKREVRASDDNVARAQLLDGAIEGYVARHRPVMMTAEAMSFARNANAAHKIGIIWGIIASIAARHNLAIAQASPKDIKKALCGKKDASKEEVIAAIRARFPEMLWPPQTSLHEHAADATGSVVACLDSPILVVARRALAV